MQGSKELDEFTMTLEMLNTAFGSLCFFAAGVRVFPAVFGEPRLPAVDREEGHRPEVRPATPRALRQRGARELSLLHALWFIWDRL